MKKFLLLILALVSVFSVKAATTFTITSDEIVSGKTGNVELGTNSYGSQSTSDNSTWYAFAKGGVNFLGVKVCKASATSGLGIQMQGNASDATKQGFLYNATAFGTKITQIVLKLNTISSNTYEPSFDVCLGTSAQPTSAITLPSPEKDKSTVESNEYKTYVYTIDVTDGSTYFAIRNDKAGALYITEIDVTYEGEIAASKKSADLAWSSSTISLLKGEELTAPTFSKSTTATVSFKSDNEAVATVSSEGVISLAGEEGTATITASSEANDEYEAGTATCKITVYHYNYYSKVTSLESGASYLLVAQRNDSTVYAYPLGSTATYGYLSVGTIKKTVDEISTKSTYNDEFIITSADEGVTIADANGRYYYFDGTHNSFSTSTDKKYWTCEVMENGTFKFSMDGGILQWGKGSYKTFAIYKDVTDGAVLPYLYKYTGTTSDIQAVNADEVISGEKATKVFEGGNFIIVKGNQKYNLNGTRVK